jgi:hypothetical protein
VSKFEAIAGEAGATDLFVLARLGTDDYVNIGGHGRGRGWAGNVQLEPAAEPWLAELVSNGIARRTSGVPTRLFGPYWTTDAIGIAAGDALVVFAGEGASERDEVAVRASPGGAAPPATEIPAEKRLADELEIAQVALEVATMRARTIGEIATGLATRAARALSCEFGAVLLIGDSMRLYLADEGWRPVASEDEIIAALLPLLPVVRNGIHVEQDLHESLFAHRPLAIDDGLVSRCAIPLGAGGSMGIVVAAHAASAPRGFTTLCQRVFATAARTVEPILADAIAANL